MSDILQFQRQAEAALQRRQLEARKEWPSFTRRAAHYSPRPDLVVGPFATGTLQLASEYDDLTIRHRELLGALLTAHRRTIAQCDADDDLLEIDQINSINRNARCFITIEIENRVSRKHLMGSAINACALGRFGIAVGWDRKMVVAFVRMRAYLRYLAGVGKNSFETGNLLILSREQLAEILELDATVA